jgi:hypothetical protein
VLEHVVSRLRVQIPLFHAEEYAADMFLNGGASQIKRLAIRGKFVKPLPKAGACSNAFLSEKRWK